MLFLLIACTSTKSTDDTAAAAGDTAGDTAADTDTGLPEGLAPLTEPSNGECPALDGTASPTFQSNGIEREVRVYLPKSPPAGMGMMVVWHPLGTTARQIATYMDLQGMADATGTLILVPEAKSDNIYEWDFWNGLDDDLVMFDDLRACAVRDLGVDPARVSAHGMSAGGLMTTFLSMKRGDSLATVSVFSGGTEPVIQWSTPASKFPALVVYGGPTDVYGSGPTAINFTETTTNYVDELRTNGQFVVLCNHDSGHTLPPETDDMIVAWNLAQRFGEPSPFEGGDLSALPEYCGVAP